MKKIFSVLLGFYILFNIAYGYNVTINGSTMKAVNAGRLVTITAPEKTGYVFSNWNVVSGEITLLNDMSRFTSFVMPSNDVSIDPIYNEAYTVTYDANGGVGAPETQTKSYGLDLVLSNAIPTYTNRTFLCWNTDPIGTGTDYAAGSTYTYNENLTLYAKWQSSTYTVKYNANGGSGVPANQTKIHGEALTLSSTVPVVSDGGSAGSPIMETSAVPVGSYIAYTGGDYDGDWVVLRNNAGTIELISKESVGDLTLGSYDVAETAVNAYVNAVKILNDKSREYINSTYAVSARSVGATEDSIEQIDTTQYPITYEASNAVGQALPYHDTYYTGDQTLIANNANLKHSGEAVWLASRYLRFTGDRANFAEWILNSDGSTSACRLAIADSDGSDSAPYGFTTYGVRPVVTLKPNIEIMGGSGTQEDPYRLDSSSVSLTNCVFNGWNTERDGSGTSYAAGATYTANSDVTLYAQWIADTYTVTYNKNTTDVVDNMPENQIKAKGTNLTLSGLIPEHTGYTFTGWKTAASSGTSYAAGATYTADANVTLYAQWIAKTYTVAYDANGGSGAPDSQTKTHGEALTLSSTVPVVSDGGSAGSPIMETSAVPVGSYIAYTGGDYDGDWVVLRNNAGTIEIISKESVGDQTLSGADGYANCVQILNDKCATYVNSTYATSGRSVGATSSSIGQINTTDNPLTFAAARAQELPYHDTYYADDQSIIANNANLKHSSGYVWLASRNLRTDSSYSRFRVRTLDTSGSVYYSFLFDAYSDGGTYTYSYSRGVRPVVSLKSEIRVTGGSGTQGDPYTIAVSSVSPNFVFNGWNTERDGSGTSYAAGATYTANSDVTLYAQWIADTYTVTYNANNGSGAPVAQTKTYGSALTLSSVEPTRANYRFTGWNTAANGSGTAYAKGATYTENADLTLYAQWADATYTVTYNANGGSGAPDSQTKIYGTNLTLSSTSPTYTGRTFTGWNTEVDGRGDSYAVSGTYSINADVTLYAQWAINAYTITYNANGGTAAPGSQTKTHGTDLVLTDIIPVYTGRTFTGWNTAANGSGTGYQPGASYTANANATLYAQWTAKTYTVAYDANGGTGAPDSQTKTHGEDLTLSSTVPVVSNISGIMETSAVAVGSYVSYQGGDYNGDWVVLRNTDGQLEIISKESVGDLTLSGANDYANAVSILNNYSRNYVNSNYAVSARSVGATANSIGSIDTTQYPITYAVAYATGIVLPYDDTYYIDDQTLIANNANLKHSSGSVWLASRSLGTAGGASCDFYVRFLKSSGDSRYSVFREYSDGSTLSSSDSRGVRPVVSLKSGIRVTGGSGTQGDPYTIAVSPTLTNGVFNGWNTERDGSGTSYAAGATYTANSDVTLYAQWIADTYTVTYNANNGSGAPGNQTKMYGVALTLSNTEPTRANYRFTGWNTAANGSGTAYAKGATYTENADLTLYAQWASATYTVTYNANGGSGAPSSQTKVHGTNLTLSSTSPTYTGRTFTGWNTEVDGRGDSYAVSGTYSINADVTLYAQWTINTYTITYNANGGTAAPGSQTKTHGTDLVLTDIIPVYTGRTFTGWNTVANGSGTAYQPGASYTANANATLYAQWSGNTYTVTYDANGGTGAPLAQTKTYGTNLTLSNTAPTRAGATFNGWNTAPNGTGTNYAKGGTYTTEADVTLYAKWTMTTYTVTYNANNGTGAPANQTKTYGTALTLSSTEPTRNEYRFIGWNTVSNGTGTVYAPGATYTENANLTLYAQWTGASYIVTYDANGGTGAPANQTKVDGVNLTLSNTEPTHAGGTFVAWNTQIDGSGTSYAKGGTYNINADVTLYAQWTLNTYTVTYNANGGTGAPANQTKTYGVELTLRDTMPVYTGRTFIGWNTAQNGSGTPYAAGATYTANAAATLYAQWSTNTYTVTYDANGGTGAPANQTKTYGTNLTLSNTVPTYTNYTFNGWNTAQDGSGTSYAKGATYTTEASVTLYAQWTRVTYTIAYNKNTTGVVTSIPDTQTKVKDTTLTLSSTIPVYEGHTFTGWNTAANGSGTSYAAGASYTANADATLYAQWTTDTYTVTYNKNTSDTVTNLPANQTKTYGTDLTLSTTVPVYTGRTFNGWNTAQNGSGTSYVAGATYTTEANVTLYAQWTINTYTITYNANSGTGAPSAQTKTHGTNLTLSSTVPVYTGRTFTGWNTAQNGSGTPYAAGATYTANAAATLYAQWTLNTYTVTYNANGGSGAPDNQTKTYGTNLTLSNTAPTHPGGTFNSWNTESNGTGTSYAKGATYTANANLTLYAQWTLNTYTITYNANNGTGAPGNQTKTYGTALTLSNTEPTRSGYKFTGWNTAANGSGTAYAKGATYTGNANLTLYAQWALNTYTVTYNANGGTGAPESQTKTHGTNLTLSNTTPTYTGRTFTGWNTEVGGTGDSYAAGGTYTVNADVTLYAQWTMNTYTVTYNANGGTGVPGNQTKIHGTALVLSNTVPVYEGHTFNGWNTVANGSGTSYAAGDSYTANSAATLYAQWTLNTYTVTYNANGGTGAPEDQTKTYGTNLTLSSTIPTYANYTFVNWNTAQDGSGTSYASGATYSTNANLTLYAQWTRVTYTVTYDKNTTGVVTSIPANQTKIYGTALTLSNTVPVYEGHTFNGWNTAANGSGTNYAAGASYTANAAVTLYAQWTTDTYAVTYNKNTSDTVSNLPSAQTKTYGVNLTLSSTVPTYAGRVFNGWNTAANGSGTSYAAGATYTANAAVTLYAQWTINTYTVTYNKNTNDTVTNIPANQTKTYGTTLTLSSTVPVYEGHIFNGWNTAANGSGTPYAAGASYTANAAVTLYAQWTTNTYTVTYNKNTSDTVTNLPGNQTKTYGVNLTLSSTVPTYAGRTFNGWNTAQDGTGDSYASGGTYTANAAVTLYAQWTLNTYTVTYNANGGTGAPSAQTKTHGTALVLSSTIPTYTGRTFNGWNTAQNGSGTPYEAGASYTANAEVTLYAQWTTNTYAVTYNANGGSGAPSAQTKTYGVDLTLSSTVPTYAGRTFNGWNTAQNGSGTPYAAGATYTANEAVTLYAQWTLNTYTIAYNANGGSGAPANQTKTYGTNLTLSSTIPTYTGRTFNGWNTAQNGSGTAYAAGATYTANEAATLYAQWTLDTYTVAYSANGGSGAPGNQTKTYGTNLTLSSTIPTYTGRTFNGWNTAANGSGTAYSAGGTYTANEAATLYAQWTINTYTVAYNKNTSDTVSNMPANQTKVYTENLVLSSTIPTYTGRTFNGWNTAANGSGTSYAPGATYSANAAVTLYAQWTLNTYAVTYNKNTTYDVTNMPANQTKTYGTNLTLSSSVPVHPGGTFNGWNTAANGSGTSYAAGATYTANEAVTLYAQWTLNTYTIQYNGAGGSGKPGNQTKTYGVDLTLSSTIPTYTGRTFTGWNTVADGSGTSYSPGGTYTANVAAILYAQWTLNTYTITYNANGGSNPPADQTKTYGIDVTLRSTTPTRSGYAFVSWNTVANGSGTSYAAGATYSANENVTLYAQWVQTYTVTYDANGGSGAPGNQTKVHGVDLTLSSTVPTRSGYVFVSWNTAANGSGTSYAKGSTYSANVAVTLYAQWTIVPAVGSYISYSGGDYTGQWVVLRNTTGAWEIISKESVGDLTLSGASDYANAVSILNDKCATYVNSTYAVSARSVGATANSIGSIDTTQYPLTYAAARSAVLPYQDTYYTSDRSIIASNANLKHSSGYVWLASRALLPNSSNSYFCVRSLYSSGTTRNDGLFVAYSDGRVRSIVCSYGVRPVVTLRSDIQVIGGSGTEGDPYVLGIPHETVAVGSYVSYSGGDYTGDWVILRDTPVGLEIISKESVGSLTLSGADGYANAVKILNDKAKEYINYNYAISARSVGATANSIESIDTTANPLTFAAARSQVLPYHDTYYTDDQTLIANNTNLKHSSGWVWLASRDLLTGSSTSGFSVRKLYSNGTANLTPLFNANSDDGVASYVGSNGVRPVITLKAVHITGGSGTSASPFTLGF